MCNNLMNLLFLMCRNSEISSSMVIDLSVKKLINIFKSKINLK